MQIRILKGTTLHGKAVAEGEILEVSHGDYYNLLEYKLCEAVTPPEVAPPKIATTSFPVEQVHKRTFAKDEGKKGK